VITNLVTIAVASSCERFASVTAKLLNTDPKSCIEITISSSNNQTPEGLLDGIGLDFSPEELFKPTSFNNMYQGLVISREFLKMIGSHLETSWDTNKTLGFSFQVTLGSQPGIPRLDNQSNYGNLVTDAEAIRILLVEDNEVNIRIAKTMLKRMGFEAETAENGLEAVTKLHQTKFHIVLMVNIDSRTPAICFLNFP